MNLALLLDLGRARRRLVLGLLAGLAALTVMYLALYPTMKEQLELFAGEMPDAMRALIGDADLATPEGYLRSEVFALTAPLLVTALAIATAVALARSERDLTLTSVFTTPLSRRALATTHLVASLLVAVAGGAVVLAAILVGAPAAGAEVGLGAIAAATVHLVVFAAALGAVAFAVAAATGSPTAGLGVGWGLLVASFAANGVAEMLDGLGWLADVSVWGWYGGGAALTDGFDPTGLALLASLGVAASLVGIARFDGRDLDL